MLGLNLMISNPSFQIPSLFYHNPIPSSSSSSSSRGLPGLRKARRRMVTVMVGPRAEEEEKGDSKGKGKGEKEGVGVKVKWAELLLNPDPDNVAAVGLAGLLTWASVQVLWQLLIVSAAILIAALKYSFIAALLLFILIALL